MCVCVAFNSAQAPGLDLQKPTRQGETIPRLLTTFHPSRCLLVELGTQGLLPLCIPAPQSQAFLRMHFPVTLPVVKKARFIYACGWLLFVSLTRVRGKSKRRSDSESRGSEVGGGVCRQTAAKDLRLSAGTTTSFELGTTTSFQLGPTSFLPLWGSYHKGRSSFLLALEAQNQS